VRSGALSFVAALLLAWGCAAPDPGAACRDRVLERLYFGLAIPGGGEVASADWEGFVDREITPRFPDGLTVHAARGQWRGAGGAIVREGSRVVEIVHDGSAAAEGRVAEIVSGYKARFRQESVLRTRSPVVACF